jgi:hypothetical protein
MKNAVFVMSSRVALERISVRNISSNQQPKHAAISPILVILMMEPIRSSEMSVLISATRRHIQEDGTIA